MQPAADAMARALDSVEIRSPCVPVVANVLAAPLTDPAAIRRRSSEQVTGTVRWRESVAWMAGQGVTQFLRSRRRQGADRAWSSGIAEGAEGVAIGTPDDVAAFVASRKA